MTIYETDQFSAAHINRERLLLHAHVEVADRLGPLGSCKLVERRVTASDKPRPARVWFTAGQDGTLTLWRANYDSSD